MEEQLNKDFTKLTTFLIGDNVFTGNPTTGEWRRCSVAEYNANVADITPAGATPDLTDGIFTFDATTKAWTKITINEFITNLNNKTTVNASPDITDSMLVIDNSTNALERLTIQQFLTRLGTTVTENTTPSLTDGIFIFDNATKTWERLSLTQLFTRLGLNVTIGSGTTFADPIIVDDDTQSTSTTTGSIQTDGGLGVVKDAFFGNDVEIGNDLEVLGEAKFNSPNGNFTPVITFGGNSTGQTYAIQDGHYYRNGNVVHFTIHLTFTSKGTSTGSAKVAGLPYEVFDNIDTSTYETSFRAGFYSNITDFSYSPIQGSDEIALLDVADQSTLDNSDFANNTAIKLSGFYFTNEDFL